MDDLVPFRYKRTGRKQSLRELTQESQVLSRIISAEANLLKLPFFTLSRNTMTLVAIECRGTRRRNGKKQEFSFEVVRGAKHLFPGILARRIHMAFLSLIRQRGLPFENPLTWTWRELCRLLGIFPGGKTEEEHKRAILSTIATTIFTNSAVYSKKQGHVLRTAAGAAMHLYDKVVFEKEDLPDGGTADTNFLWLADWYVENLNALYSAPIDYDFWLALDAKSHVASRLYEFLPIKFYKREKALSFNYPTLVQYLPLKPKRFLSDAHRQLDEAFELLIEAGILEKVQWNKPKNPKDLALLHIHRGELLSSDSLLTLPSLEEEDAAEMVEVREVHITPEELVAQFYELWDKTKPALKPAEQQQAKELIEKYGSDKAKALIPKVVQRMKKKWPEAKTFGAISRYVEEVAVEYERQEKATEAKRQAAERDRQERKEQETQMAEKKRVRDYWLSLTAEEQKALEAEAFAAAQMQAKTDQEKEHVNTAKLNQPGSSLAKRLLIDQYIRTTLANKATPGQRIAEPLG